MFYAKEEDILLGKRLQEIREGLGRTREEFAELFGLSVEQYKRLEQGKSRITVDKIRLLYNVYHVDPTYLIIGKRSTDVDLDYFLTNSLKEEKTEITERVIDYIRLLALR